MLPDATRILALFGQKPPSRRPPVLDPFRRDADLLNPPLPQKPRDGGGVLRYLQVRTHGDLRLAPRNR